MAETKPPQGAAPATPATPATPPVKAAKEEKVKKDKDDARPKEDLSYISNEDNVKQSNETRKAVKVANPGAIDEAEVAGEEVKPTPEEEENKKILENEEKAFEERRKKIPQTTAASQGKQL